MKKEWIVAAMVLALAVGAGAQGVSSEYVLSIGSGDVTTYTPAVGVETGTYYKLDFDVPEVDGGAVLESAYLEFYVDVQSVVQGDFHWFDADSVEHIGYEARTPLVEVFALTSPVAGAVQEGQLDKTTAARRPVLVGTNRRVVVNITPIVRAFIDNPSRNLGIVVGSFTGTREANFTLRTGDFPDESRARVSITVASAWHERE